METATYTYTPSPSPSPLTPPPVEVMVPAAVPSTPPAPGWTTSEFWTNTVLVIGILLLLALGRISISEVVQLWPFFVSSGLYSLSRGIAKVRN